MPSYTLEVKVKISLLVHHDCIKTLYKAYITQVYGKEIKSVRSGLLEHTLCKFSCWVFWCFVFFVFFFLIFFFVPNNSCKPNQLGKRRHILFSSWFKCYYSLCIHCDFTPRSYETLLNWTVPGKEKKHETLNKHLNCLICSCISLAFRCWHCWGREVRNEWSWSCMSLLQYHLCK